MKNEQVLINVELPVEDPSYRGGAAPVLCPGWFDVEVSGDPELAYRFIDTWVDLVWYSSDVERVKGLHEQLRQGRIVMARIMAIGETLNEATENLRLHGRVEGVTITPKVWKPPCDWNPRRGWRFTKAPVRMVGCAAGTFSGST